MRKFLALAAMVLGLASCQTEPEGLDVNMGDGTTTISVVLPEEAITRAGGTDSAASGLDNVSDEIVRVVMHIYDENGNVSEKRYVDYLGEGETTVNFDVRLVPNRKYTFVAWADQVDDKADVDKYFNTENLAKVTIIEDTWTAMNEGRDAFTATHTEASYTSSSNITLKLTRPFAKLRVVTTDMKNLNDLSVVPTKATVTYRTTHYTAFDAVSGKAIAKETTAGVEHKEYTIASYGENWAEGADMTLFTDYFFAADEAEAVNFEFGVYDQNGKLIKSNNFNTDIPVKRNNLTTLKGNILTDGGNIKVTVDKQFGMEETINIVNTAEDLQEQIDNIPDGGEGYIGLGGDIDLNDLLGAGILSTRASEPAYGLLIPAGKELVLDLNGYTIKQERECTASYSMIENKGTLTIKDGSVDKSGKLSFTDTSAGDPNYGWGSYTITNRSGKLVVESGTIEHLGQQEAHMICAIFQYNGSTTINGGTISTPAYHSARLWSGDMTINGGLFEGQLWLQAVDDSANLAINGGEFAPCGNDMSSVFVGNTKSVAFEVTGGKFKTKIGATDATKIAGAITGGFFTADAKENTPAALINDDYAWVEQDGLWTLERKTDVVKIGEVGYTSLQKAFDAAEDSEIILICDLSLTDMAVLAEGKSAVLDLNGYNINVAYNESTGKHIYALSNYGELTIKDSKSTGSINARGIYNQDGAKLTINAVKVVGQDWNGGACVWSYGTGEVYLNNATFVGNTGCVSSEGYLEINGGVYTCHSAIDADGTQHTAPTFNIRAYNGLKITDGTFTSRHGVISIGGGEAVLENGNYTIQFAAATTSNVVYIYGDADVTIENGNYISDDTADKADSGAAVLVSGSTASLDIHDGVFVGMNGTVSGNDNTALYGGTYSTVWDYNHYGNLEQWLADGCKVVDNGDGTLSVVVTPAAKIGDTEYYSLQEAFNVGGNISLLRDVKVTEPATLAAGKSAVLDLNGKTLTAELASALVATEGAHLTVKNGNVIAYESTIRAIGGTVVVESGEYTSTGTALDSPATYRYSLDCREGGELIVNGGTFKSNNGMLNVGSTMIINGGKFDNRIEKVMTRHMAYVSAPLTINGGEFYGEANGAAGGCFFCGAAAGCEINITDGKFTSLWTSGSANRIFEVYYGGTINVSGGLFNTNGGITGFVEANTDAATKDAYPYVAKQ